MNIASRLAAIEALARRKFCPTPASASAALTYVAALAIVAEVFSYVDQLEAGRGDAAALRLGPYDLSALRARRHAVTSAIEAIAGFGAVTDQNERREALARLASQMEIIRNNLSTSAVLA